MIPITRRCFNSWSGAIAVAICAALTAPAVAQSPDEQKFPDVVSVRVSARGADRFDFDATISSPYDTPQRYADAFRAMSKDGTVFGERILFHDHAGEQPFTRDLYSVTIPNTTREVVIQARDKRYGYGGRTVTVALPGR
jgi:hypothetical protein